ncbi:hypothetical protein [Luteithermobacter gelatinilyticus]|uniref:hypothetical protein n=1 Tax=Luteithermobacter gelatinilyticus TaxID=2582913 RepID=UPI00143CD563|nr:hypothetical protein [Luteithermobacter gelatinilyticus]
MTFRIAILVFDGYEELDAIGPWEIFRVAQDLKPDELNCVILSPDGRDVHAAKGLKTG